MHRQNRARRKAASARLRARQLEAKRKARELNGTPLYWLWEFSKKVVVITAALYFASFIYSMLMCYRALSIAMDTGALSTLVTEANETFRVVVGGYLVKAGVENAAKIITAHTTGTKEEETTEENDETGQLG